MINPKIALWFGYVLYAFDYIRNLFTTPKILNKPIHIIYIDGNISGGKSSLMTNLSNFKYNNHQITIMKEPLGLWDGIKDKDGLTLFKKYYSERSRYSYTFQQFVLLSKIDLLRNTIKELDKKENNILFVERSFMTDSEIFAKMCYENKFMNDLEYQIYNMWYKFVTDILCSYEDEGIIKQHYICLNTKSTICYDRLRKRNRDGEEGISLEYLETLESKHKKLCEDNPKIIVIDNDKNIFTNDDINNQINNLFMVINKKLI
jgi:deoxyadenosine/deoxycytidine kinase